MTRSKKRRVETFQNSTFRSHRERLIFSAKDVVGLGAIISVEYSPVFDEVRPHLHEPLLGVRFRRCLVEVHVEDAEVEKIAELVAVTDARPVHVQQPLVQPQSAIVRKSIHVRAVGGELCVHLHGIRHSTQKHFVGQQENHFLDRFDRYRASGQIEVTDSVGHQARLARVPALRDVQVGGDEAVEVGIELLQQTFVLLETCRKLQKITFNRSRKSYEMVLTSHEKHRLVRVEARHQRHFMKPSLPQQLLGVLRQERLVVLVVEFTVRLQNVLNRWHKSEAHVFTAVLIVDCLRCSIDDDLRLNLSQKLCENQISERVCRLLLRLTNEFVGAVGLVVQHLSQHKRAFMWNVGDCPRIQRHSALCNRALEKAFG